MNDMLLPDIVFPDRSEPRQQRDLAKIKVACVVLNQVKSDARVLKEARSLQEAGYDVKVFGIRSGPQTVEFQYEGVVVTLFGHRGLGRSMVLLHLTTIAVLGLLAITAIVLSYMLFAILAHKFGLIGYEIVVAVVATILAGVLGLLSYRRVIAWARAVIQVLQVLVTGGSSPDAAMPSFATVSTEQPSRFMAFASALFDPRSCVWVARLIDRQSTIYRALREREIDIVHCHDFTTLRVGAALKRLRPNIRLIYDSHELFSAVFQETAARRNWIRLYENRTSREVDACSTVNDSIANELKRYYPALPRPVVLCNATPPVEDAPGSQGDAAGVLIDDGRLRKAAGLSCCQKILLFQGGIARHRGLRALTMAATFLPKDWFVVYMGWGDYEKELRQIAGIIDESGERIRFVPPVPQSELAQWTAGATIGVIPYEPISLNHLYCSPNKLWEYPRSGVPVLCSDAPEMRRRVEQYGFGWIIPWEQLTPRGIATMVASLSDQEIARAKRACLDFIKADNWCVYEQRLLDVYDRLAG